MKLIVRIAVILLIAGFITFPKPSSASPGTSLSVNGQTLRDIQCVFAGDRLLVPARPFCKPLNIDVVWDAGMVLLTRDGKTYEFREGERGVWSGGKVFCLDVPPQMIHGRFYVPLRFLCDSFEAEVFYREGEVAVRYPSTGQEAVVLNFAGDTTLAWYFEKAAGDDLLYPFALSPWLSEADITMVNLENPITDRGYKVPKQFNFRMPPKYTQTLLSGGIDIVNLANNHLWDYGPVGVRDTVARLDEAGILHVGGGESQDAARRPAIMEVKGKRIGFLGYYNNLEYIEEDIRSLKQRADIVVVNFHWGKERSNYPESVQKTLARRAVDAGADLVVGHHPHVLQGMERYKGGVIVYSLGNFIFGGNSRGQHDTVVFQFIIRDGQRYCAVIPVRVMNWQAIWLRGDEGKEVIHKVKKYSETFVNALL